jgi:hypothetical protein
MIVVSVKLVSAIHPSRSKELARMDICNIGGADFGDTHGTYKIKTYIGRSKEALDKRIVNRAGSVSDYPRLALHVWHLVAEALKSVNYQERPK